MISATILNIIQDGTNISLDYVLTDDSDPSYSVQGELPISIGLTSQDIASKLAPIVDAANYAASLKPLISTQVTTPNGIPQPVTPILFPKEAV